MKDFDIPIIKTVSDLYIQFHEYRKLVPKHDRFTIYERSEAILLQILENLFEAGYLGKSQKLPLLEQASIKLNVFRFLVRTMKETRTLDMKKYQVLQQKIDELGRMLGGWIRSTKG